MKMTSNVILIYRRQYRLLTLHKQSPVADTGNGCIRGFMRRQ